MLEQCDEFHQSQILETSNEADNHQGAVSVVETSQAADAHPNRTRDEFHSLFFISDFNGDAERAVYSAFKPYLGQIDYQAVRK